ncbi:hypothetical protein Xen7305DRAFT_00008600 [Xenococcus sp. PCC 7305]|uniref:hypothetical protein n=1 Tax=Xenococcus sp. PCC 7305 TaxID=102125 RepID=UPI0002AB9CD1|nr:hypothetical protein [Xenococcus sp. PCC 7305]ELS01158.1 hypothetical protein Xen7305DRAFT_00008600 [Xenococcus sp. PCC 7305]
MTTTLMARQTYLDIAKWWPKDESGKDLSVYAAHKQVEEIGEKLHRYTLTRAKDGRLEKCDLSSLKVLARLCSKWSGSLITVDDLIVEREEE